MEVKGEGERGRGGEREMGREGEGESGRWRDGVMGMVKRGISFLAGCSVESYCVKVVICLFVYLVIC
jgi:hypothetical protein